MPSLQRMLHVPGIIILILLFLFSQSGLSWLFHSPGSEPSRPSSAVETIEEDGFTLALQGVTISGDADVAPIGTEIHAELITPEIPATIAEFAEPVGTGVEITLGDNQQPTTPLTITFAPGEVAKWYAATEGDPDLVPIVFASNDRELGVEFADAHLMPDGSVTVYTDHLSEFYPGVTRVSNFSTWLVDEIATTFGARSDQPGCYNQSNHSEWAVLGIIDQVFWPCVTEVTSGAYLKLSNNSPAVWMVSSEVAQPGAYPSITSASGIVVAAGARLIYSPNETAILMPPDGGVSFSIFGDHDEVVFNAQLNYGLTTVNAIVNTTITLMPASKAKLILDDIGKGECFISIIQETVGGVQVDGSFARMVFECMGTFIEGMPGTLISSITTVPGATIAMADATYRTLAGTDQFTFTLSRVSSDSSAWPTDRNDSVTGLYIWLGANFYDFPDWVACDDAREWCLIGYDGERHLLIKAKGLEAMYWIDDNVPSPREALLSTGLTESQVQEILGD